MLHFIVKALQLRLIFFTFVKFDRVAEKKTLETFKIALGFHHAIHPFGEPVGS